MLELRNKGAKKSAQHKAALRFRSLWSLRSDNTVCLVCSCPRSPILLIPFDKISLKYGNIRHTEALSANFKTIMLEEPKLSTKKIITCLQDSYNLLVSHITFHSLGNDPNSWVYEVDTSNKKYFLKVKKEKIYAPSLEVPRFLKDQGIGEVLAPVKNKEQKLWVCVEEFYLILYLFVEGATGREIGMTQGQWVRFGSVLRKVHSSKLPPELLQKIRKENFIPRCA